MKPKSNKPFKTKLNSGMLRNDEVLPAPRVHMPSVDGGEVVSIEVRRKIRAALLSGEHPQLATIARANGVSRDFVQRMLDSDPELAASVRTSLAITGEQIEKAAIDMCLNDELNPIAREKMIEFCLPKMMPEKYGESAGLSDATKNLPKIQVSLTLPVVEKKEEIIEVNQ